VDTWVSRVGNSSFVVDGEIRDGDVVLSRARVVMVAFDADTGRSVPLTESQKDGLLGRKDTRPVG